MPSFVERIPMLRSGPLGIGREGNLTAANTSDSMMPDMNMLPIISEYRNASRYEAHVVKEAFDARYGV